MRVLQLHVGLLRRERDAQREAVPVDEDSGESGELEQPQRASDVRLLGGRREAATRVGRDGAGALDEHEVAGHARERLREV